MKSPLHRNDSGQLFERKNERETGVGGFGTKRKKLIALGLIALLVPISYVALQYVQPFFTTSYSNAVLIIWPQEGQTLNLTIPYPVGTDGESRYVLPHSIDDAAMHEIFRLYDIMRDVLSRHGIEALGTANVSIEIGPQTTMRIVTNATVILGFDWVTRWSGDALPFQREAGPSLAQLAFGSTGSARTFHVLLIGFSMRYHPYPFPSQCSYTISTLAASLPRPPDALNGVARFLAENAEFVEAQNLTLVLKSGTFDFTLD